jgi:hypothetical protein
MHRIGYWRTISGRPRRGVARASLLTLLLLASSMLPDALGAQSRVGKDSSTRATRYGRDVVYGTAMGFVYAGVDQLRNDPAEWGKGWRGYEKRLASDIGEFLIQETVTTVLAASLDRPLDYQLCHCRGTGRRLGWALHEAVTDVMPDGSHPVAIPRIVGAYAGSFSQAAWRPDAASGRLRTGLVNGTVSLLIGAGINVYYEVRGR